MSNVEVRNLINNSNDNEFFEHFVMSKDQNLVQIDVQSNDLT